MPISVLRMLLLTVLCIAVWCCCLHCEDAAVVLPQEQKPPEVIPSEPAKPTYDDQWFDDPIEVSGPLLTHLESSALGEMDHNVRLIRLGISAPRIWRGKCSIVGNAECCNGWHLLWIDVMQGEEAIRMEQQLRQKIEEKAEPVRTWLVSSSGTARQP